MDSLSRSRNAAEVSVRRKISGFGARVAQLHSKSTVRKQTAFLMDAVITGPKGSEGVKSA
jgi:hypothetical protein